MSEGSAPGAGSLRGDLEGVLGRAGVTDDGEPPVPEDAPAVAGAGIAAGDGVPKRMVVLLPRLEPPRRRRPAWVLPAAVVAGVALLAGGAFALGRSTSGSSQPAAAPATTTPASTAARPTTPAAATTLPATTAPAATSPETTAPAPATTAAASAPTSAPAATLEPRSAVFAGGKVYLRGAVPDEATASTIVERAGTIVGAENVVNEYVVDPAAPVVDSAPLRVADTVQFAPGSTVVAPQFQGLLDLGVALMQRYPNVRVTVLGHTDDDGPDAYNQELSQRRVDAVVRYLAGKGVPVDRVTGVAKGEAEPLAANDTPEGRRLNRRIEFVITGLLG